MVENHPLSKIIYWIDALFPFDNIFYFKSRLKVIETGIIPFYQHFETLQRAREISDHVPVYIKAVLL